MLLKYRRHSVLGIFIFVHFIQDVYPRHNVLLAKTVSRKQLVTSGKYKLWLACGANPGELF